MFTWPELLAATDGEWLVPPPVDGGIERISTHSDKVSGNALFLALRGERFDGHDFAAQAVANGAAAAIVDHAVDNWPDNLPCLQVADTLAAYQALALAHRRRFPDLPLVAVTGSSGKTSTKEMIASILAAHFDGPVLKTIGNTNNQVGVPQNLLRLRPEHAAAVIEMGTNAPGEIAPLAATAEPTVAVLTSIGPVHLERLGSLDGVAREKSAVFTGLAARGGGAVIPAELADNAHVSAALEGVRLVTVGGVQADVTVAHEPINLGRSCVRLSTEELGTIVFDWSLAGEHQAGNAGLAAGVARLLGIGAGAIREGLTQVALPDMRMAITSSCGVTWINDAYNANPDSMRAFLAWLAAAPRSPAPLWLILGDMLELGDDADRYHREILAAARKALPRAVILPVGPQMSGAAADLGITGYADVAALRRVLRTVPLRGARVALKGSRGMRLERLLPGHDD